MASYPTKLLETFAAKAIVRYYQRAVADAITNNDYEGEIKDRSSILNILTFGAIASHTYTGADMSVDDPTESNGQLNTNQAKYFYFKVKSYDTFRAYIKNPEGTILDQVANELKKVVDQFVLGLYGSVQAGQRVGTDYTTGTVTVTTGTGAVVGSSTVFTAAMVGRGFKAAGHSSWYRVATFTDTTHITIVDDLDDSGAGAYTGGAIGGGATYTVEANTAVQITASNVFDKFEQLQSILDEAEIPEEDRWVVIPPRISNLITQSSQFNNNTAEARQEATLRGYVGEFAGFKVYKVSTVRLGGDSVNGWHLMAGHKSAITFAMGLTENGMEDLRGNFGKAYKSLYVYGAKVVDERRKALTELFAKL